VIYGLLQTMKNKNYHQMKLFKSVLLFGMLAVLMSSCVYSLFPIYTLDTLIYEKELLGTYVTKDATIEVTPGKISASKNVETSKFNGNISVTESPNEDDTAEEKSEYKKKAGYTFKVTYDKDILLYDVHLVKIANEYYIDMFPQNVGREMGYEKGDPNSDNLYPVHTFLKVEFNDKELRLINFNLGRLNEMFKKNLIRLRHEIVFDMLTSTKESGDVIITAKPAKIQKFISTYSKDPSVFYKPEIYKRK